jgi:hypothetical protein
MKKLSLTAAACMGAGLIALQLISVSAFAQTSYRIIDRWKNNYLCDTGANVAYQPAATGTQCQWQIMDVSGYKSFRNLATNDYLHIESLTGSAQAAGGDSSWWSAQWTLETIDSTYSWIRNRWQSAHYLHVENQTGFLQSGDIDKNWWGSQWRFEVVTGTASSGSVVSSSNASSSIRSSSVISSSTLSSSAPSSTVPSSSSSSPVSSIVSSSIASSSSSVGTAITYQAEDNFYSGGVTNAGTYLQNFIAQGARTIVAVNTNNADNYSVSLRYANGSGSDKTLNVYVNGLKTLTTTLAPTGGNTTWANKAETLALRAGFNSISYQYDAGNSGGVNIDSVAVAGGVAMAQRGATLSYQTYEAEAATTNGQVSAYGTTFPSVESESSGRQFVTLNSTGHYVQWTSSKAANTLVVRYNMPEAPNGGGTSNTLSLYVNGTKVRTLDLSSHFAWTYGGYPFNNDNPSGGGAHHFYDDSQFTGLNIPAGATVKLQRDATDTAAFYKIDFIELEQIEAAYTMPANFVSITSQGATANDGSDDTQALINTINYAKQMGMGVWIPAGIFNINARINDLNNVHIRGAGMWYTRLQGSNGQGGFYANGSNVTIADMTIASDSYYRDNGGHTAAIEGDFGTGSLVQNIWVEHMKVGVWLKPNTDGLLITNGRIRNTWADGVNFHAGVKNSTISHFNVRNNGDDSFAMWSQPGSINVNNSFRFNTAQMPILANTYAIYGGQDNKVLDNIGADTVRASAGIAISTRGDFPGGTAPFTGTTEVKRNTLNRTGGWEPNWSTSFGAFWIYADGQSINAPIVIDHLTINNSLYEAILFSYGQQITNLSVNNVQINGAGTYGLNFNGVMGSGIFSNVTVSGTGSAALQNPNNQFSIVRGSGNSGW